MFTAPLSAPAVCGAKVTVNVVLCDAFRVKGAVMPLSEKPAPEIDACEMSTLVPPTFVRTTVCDCWLPSTTLPKSSNGGLNVNCPGVTGAPLPVRERFTDAFEASLAIVAVALKVLAAFGVN